MAKKEQTDQKAWVVYHLSVPGNVLYNSDRMAEVIQPTIDKNLQAMGELPSGISYGLGNQDAVIVFKLTEGVMVEKVLDGLSDDDKEGITLKVAAAA